MMKQYEFEHVRMKHGIAEQLSIGYLSKKRWEEKLTGILAEMGNKGWDLKSAHSETMTMHTHLIFSREKS